jgi:glycosyltransferase involved in cell wall biosynthesis
MKNYQLLVEVLRLLPPNVKAIMVGTGPEDAKIERLIADYGLRSRVVRIRNIPEFDLYGLYRIADCYVSPTLVTDIQMGIMEAMCFGLPVVSTAQDYMIDGNGYVVAMNDPSALVDGIVRVMMEDRHTMGKRSKELAQQYDFKMIAEKAIEIYKGL